MNIFFEENGKLYRFDGHEENPPGFKPDEPGICSLEQVDCTSLKPLKKYEEVHVHDCLRAIAEIRNEILESSPYVDFYEFFELVESLRIAELGSWLNTENQMRTLGIREKLDELITRINKLTGGAE